jgi:hypothetical protein
MKYPVGPQTQKKAAQTEPGKLAALLNRVLYSADTKDIEVAQGYVKKRWVAENEFYRGEDPLPEGLAAKPNYCTTEELMRAIRDYLEFRSFEEVIP